MITLPPSERDLHAYVDDQLDQADRAAMETFLAANPEVSEQVRVWQQDAYSLRAGLSGDLHRAPNPQLDPGAVRQRIAQQRRQRFAAAAVLLIAVSLGGVGGWQARNMSLIRGTPPMADAVQAYRLFAGNAEVASDWSATKTRDVQDWLDSHFARANRLPNLASAGFRPVSGRLTATEQGPAALVMYKDEQGRVLSFYIRPPGESNHLLPRGTRRDGELQADYWSDGGYNYAVVARADDPAAQAARRAF